jgi:SMI1/KNR4 family protein SUKH-1
MAQFDIVAASFWDPNDPRQALPPFDEAGRANAEAILGVDLAAALLHLLRIKNGGRVAAQWRAHPAARNHWAIDHVPFREILGLGPTGSGAPRLTMLDTPYLVAEWDLPTPVVLLSGDGHWWVALDYRVSGPQGEPSVAWIDNEMGEELTLAPNFRTFVEGLMPVPDDRD